MYAYPDGTRRPIAFASRRLNEHKKRCGQIDKEALAIAFGLKGIHLYLYSRHFTILADQNPLERICASTAILSLAAKLSEIACYGGYRLSSLSFYQSDMLEELHTGHPGIIWR